MSDIPAAEYRQKLDALKRNLASVIYGKDESLDLLIIALLAGGSVLIEDVPGVGKTTLAKALARSVDAEFRRIQFTPDLLPADILGSSIYNPVDGSFKFRKGPIFCNVLLADEINRASPRTQSALLEAMNEMQATIEGKRYPLPGPFMVVATENPVEYHGTYPLPEAQLDRFLVLLSLGYPRQDVEADILHAQTDGHPLDRLKPVVTKDEVVGMQQAVKRVHVDPSVSAYMVDIVSSTRQDPRIRLGGSPRGSLMLFRASQARAFYEGRNYVSPDDVQKLAGQVLAHRIVLTSKSRYGGTARRDVIEDIVKAVKVPT